VVTLAEHYGMPADQNVPDVHWIQEATAQGWQILMKDKRIRIRAAEISAVVEHKARCFVITRGDLTSADMAQRLLDNKAAIYAAAAETGPYIYSVQVDRLLALRLRRS
jgi:hypothetical protein